ncbi:MAG TPA: hypothetical protein VM241_04155 [Candidatus Thermoplasmatota archaeon]|nr:hypothetical protein [Candidatus Thermoplasmatota archaeon]
MAAPRKAVRKSTKKAAKRVRPAPKAPKPAAPAKPTAKELPEVAVVVARSLVVEGRVEVRGQPPAKRVRVPLGSLLLVRHAYQLEEASTDRETFTFTLEATLGEHAKEPVVQRFADRLGVPDDFIGNIQQRFRPKEAGTYRVTFAAKAEYEVKAWGSRKAGQRQHGAARGHFTVVVE